MRADDYIKREDAEHVIVGFINNPHNQEYVKEVLDRIPSADVVEVVRCKDCRYKRLETSDEGTSYYWCVNARVGLSVDEDNYCCWGERVDMRGSGK